MRVFDRWNAVVVALAFVLAGLGAPACPEAHQPGPPVAAAHRSIGPDAARPAYPGTPPHLRAELVGGPCGDHRAGVGATDGPDDLLLAAPPRVDGTAVAGPTAVHYRQPVVPLPPRGTVPTRAPPVTA